MAEVEENASKQVGSLAWYEKVHFFALIFLAMTPFKLLDKVVQGLFGKRFFRTANDPIEKVADNVWQVRGWTTHFYPQLDTRMTIVRLSDDSLAVFNAVNPTAATLSELNKLGSVSHIVGLTPFHEIS